jgi:hypothetical protein
VVRVADQVIEVIAVLPFFDRLFGWLPPYPTCYPTAMRKTSLYLEEADLVRLRRLATREGRSQAEIVRAAIAAYESQQTAHRSFALTSSWEGDGSSVADTSEDELLQGFGD